MNKTPFFSTKVNEKLKRVGVVLFLIIPFPLMLYVIGMFCYELVDNSLRNHYSESQIKENIQPLVLGTADISNLDKEDEPYYKDADVFINGEWKPNGYIEIPKAIDIPQYDITIGSVVSDTWDIGGDQYTIKCEEIDKEKLQNPPYCPLCTLQINDYVINEYVRSDIICEDYDNFINPKNCKLQVGIILYANENLKYQYLFLSSESVGSIYANFAYQISKGWVEPIYFDFNDSISESLLTRGDMDLYMAFSDLSKTDFRLISHFWDPSMKSIQGMDREWKAINGRWLSDKKIVSL